MFIAQSEAKLYFNILQIHGSFKILRSDNIYHRIMVSVTTTQKFWLTEHEKFISLN